MYLPELIAREWTFWCVENGNISDFNETTRCFVFTSISDHQTDNDTAMTPISKPCTAWNYNVDRREKSIVSEVS